MKRISSGHNGGTTWGGLCSAFLVTGVVGVVCWGLAAAQATAGGGPANVAVVVNDDSWASQTVANHYVQVRGIPARNVIHLTGLKGFQRMDVETFRNQILLPVMKTLWERGVLSQIDSIAYSADFPTAIDASKDLAGAEPAKPLPPTGSINGLTYLYQLVLAKRPEYMQLANNFYMRRQTDSIEAIPSSAEDRQAYVESQKLLVEKKWDEAAKVLQPLAAKLPANAGVQYNLACCLARLGRTDEAIESLLQAVKAGWSQREHAEKDEDLASLRDSVNFKALLGKMDENGQRAFDVQPTLAFQSELQWNDRGELVSDGGIRYMMSTVLAVTSGRGNSVSEALAALRSSAAADATQPKGTVYFMENSDIRSTTRAPAFVSAVRALEKTPVRGKIEKGTLPQGKSDIVGLMAGSATFDWNKSNSTIVPGAICEHLTSFGGAMQEGAGQTPLSEFIRAGAAGTSGTVVEPYAIQAKFPFAFIHVHYARGCNLAESFYQSVFGPYQLLIVGDPLCQPWAQQYEVQVDQLQPNQRVSGTLVVKPTLAGVSDLESVLDHFELFMDGKRGKVNPQLRSYSIDTTSFGDGWHELRVVAVAKGPIASQSCLVLPLVVDNQGKSVELAFDGKNAEQVNYGDEITVRASAAGAAEMVVTSHSVELGKIAGPSGTLTIDTRRLGMGPVRLQATAQVEGTAVSSAPLACTVVAPKPIAAIRSFEAKGLKPGLRLTLDGKDAGTVEGMKNGKWLADKAKEATGQKLKLDGYFTASSAELYQFQFKGNAVSEIMLDDKPVWKAADSSHGAAQWTMVPVSLAKGWHHLELTGTIAKSPALEIRFGHAGCQLVDGERFQHLD